MHCDQADQKQKKHFAGMFDKLAEEEAPTNEENRTAEDMAGAES